MSKKADLKIEVAKVALEMGVSKAAELYGVSRQSVSVWLKKYKDSGENGLVNPSRQGQLQPHKMAPELEKQILELKEAEPHLSAAAIKNRLNLGYSLTIINKKIKRLNQSAHFNIKQGEITNLKLHFKKHTATNLNIFIIQSNNQDLFYALAEEKSAISATLFLELFLLVHQQFLGKQELMFAVSTHDRMLKGGLFAKRVVDLGGIVVADEIEPLNLPKQISQISTKEELLSRLGSLQLEHNLRSVKKEQKKFILAFLPFLVEDYLKQYLQNGEVALQSFIQTQKSTLTKICFNLLSKAQTLAEELEIVKAEELIKILELLHPEIGDFKFSQDLYRLWGELLQKQSSWEEAEKSFNLALEFSRKSKDPYQIVRGHAYLAAMFNQAGNYKNAEKHLKAQLKACSELPQSKERAVEESVALQILGVLEERLGNYRQALNAYNQILSLVEITGNLVDKAKTLGNMGVVYYKTKRLSLARKSYEEAIFLAEMFGDKRQQARLLCNLGALYDEQLQPQKALTCYEKFYNLALELKNENWQGAALANIGLLHLDGGRYLPAMESFNSLLKTAEKLNNRENQAIALANIALVHRGLKSFDSCRKYLNMAINIAKKEDETYYLTGFLFDLLQLEVETLKVSEAELVLKEAKVLLKRSGREEFLPHLVFYETLITFYQTKKILPCLEGLQKQFSSCKDQELQARIAIYLTRFYTNYTDEANRAISWHDKAEELSVKLYKKTGKIIFKEYLEQLSPHS